MKKEYIVPTLKCIEFKVELGFVRSSLTQGLINYFDDDDDDDDDDYDFYRPGSTGDWD